MKMFKSKFVVAASFVLATTSAFADSADQHINDWSTFSSTVTRAVVLAELREAQRLGLVSIGEGNMPIATAEQERLIAKAGRDAAKQFAKPAGDVVG
jgi:hypothetical protein